MYILFLVYVMNSCYNGSILQQNIPNHAYVTKPVHQQIALFIFHFLFLCPSYCMSELIINVHYNKKVKVKLSCYMPWRHTGGERRYSTYSYLTSALDGVSSQHRALATLYPQGKNPQYPLGRRLGGPQSQSGRRR
jgi:hypothetical protein